MTTVESKTIAVEARTRFGTIDRILVEGDVLVFVTKEGDSQQTRRMAVAWLGAAPHRGLGRTIAFRERGPR